MKTQKNKMKKEEVKKMEEMYLFLVTINTIYANAVCSNKVFGSELVSYFKENGIEYTVTSIDPKTLEVEVFIYDQPIIISTDYEDNNLTVKFN